MAKTSVLIVEDDEHIQQLVEYNLLKEGYDTECVASGEEALKAASARRPDVLLLDLMLPGVDGLRVCRTLKGDPKTAHVPVIMLTAKGEEEDVVAGLEMGADDYITKPFSPRVLLARIKTVLRRQSDRQGGKAENIKIDDLVIDSERHEVLIDGSPVNLTYTEFMILHFLARQPGFVRSRAQIVNAVHGEESAVTDRSVDVQIVSLRKKMGSYGKYIQTVRNVGYKFKD